MHEKEKEEVVINEEDRKSSTFSSKSSLLEKMVNKFSSSKEIDSQDISVKCSTNEKQDENVVQTISRIKAIPEKLGLVERVNVLLDRNDNHQSSKSSFSSALENFKNKFIKTDGNQTDISKSNEIKGTVEHIDKKQNIHEDLNDYSENQRIQLLETFCQSRVKRCISNDSWAMNTFDDVDLVYNLLPSKKSPKSFHRLKRSRSCEMVNGLFHNLPPVSMNQESGMKEKKLLNENDELFMPKPIWISGRAIDTFRFLIQWLAVSLSDIPLVILELQPSLGASNKSDEATKNIIAKICIEADKKRWTTGDLMAIISREYFQNTNESVEDCARRALYFNS